MATVKSVVDKALAFGIGLLLLTSLGLGFFSQSYRFCQNKQWEGASGSVYTNCSNRYQDAFNQTPISVHGTPHTENGEANPVNSDALNCSAFCLNCSTLGAYRGITQGILTVLFVLFLFWAFVKFV